jgi:hypothetical protein
LDRIDPDESFDLVARWAEETGFARERDRNACLAPRAFVTRHALARIAAQQEAIDRVCDDVAKPSELV